MMSLNAPPLKSKSFLRLFWTSTQGNMAIMAALFIGVLAVIVSGTLDIAGKTSNQKELQHIVDAAALAAAREMAVSAADQTRVQAVAESYVNANWNGDPAKTKAILDVKNGLITVHSEITAASIALIQEGDGKDTFSAEAVAEVSGGGNICLIALSPNDVGAIDLQNKARITAAECQVYSNSDNFQSLVVKTLAKVAMDFVCVAGGIGGDPTKLGGSVITDCPSIHDPLSSRSPPSYNENDCYNNATNGTKIVKQMGNVVLKPGVYCGGLNIIDANVTFEPGIYIIKGGSFFIGNGAIAEGKNVGFFLTENANLHFHFQSEIAFTAPKTGPMASLLFFEDKPAQKSPLQQPVSSQSKGKVQETTTGSHRISSDGARILEGTIYLPHGDLIIDGQHPIADESNYTVIIAKSFKLSNGPNLVIKTDYHLSDIPLPQGVGAQDVTIRLKR